MAAEKLNLVPGGGVGVGLVDSMILVVQLF
jgi:hypothetical protein